MDNVNQDRRGLFFAIRELRRIKCMTLTQFIKFVPRPFISLQKWS